MFQPLKAFNEVISFVRRLFERISARGGSTACNILTREFSHLFIILSFRQALLTASGVFTVAV
jgi:hypothetical protein